MNRSKLKTYAPQARRDFIQAVTDRAAIYGLTPSKIDVITEKGDVAIIGGRPFPISVADKRRRLEERVKRHGFDHVMEAMAYTWFNRLVAIRYMEIHGYLDHGYRVLSNADASKSSPEIVEHAEHVDLPGLDRAKAVDLKLDGTKESELYQMLLLAQCHALHKAMPFLFERIDDETELLLPDNLLHSDSIIRKLVNEIEEADWQRVEIIGWLYEDYISDKYSEVIGSVVAAENIPAATQKFTPNWVVKYLVQNTVGRQWLATYPQSALRGKMQFYIEPAAQMPAVQALITSITPESLNPEELTLMDSACGSGHILVEAYDLLKEIYLERGYRLRDIPKLILTKNLFGLEIDDRATQLAAFALMMKARADDRRIFDGDIQPNVLAIQESNSVNIHAVVQAFNEKKITQEDDLVSGEFGFMGAVRTPLLAMEHRASSTLDDKLTADLKAVFSIFENAKTYGSLVTIPHALVERLPAIASAVKASAEVGNLGVQNAASIASVFINQAALLSRRFDFAVANPPYMGSKYYAPKLKTFVNTEYKDAKPDLYACFIQRNASFAKPNGFVGMITIPNWMFLSSFEGVRQSLFDKQSIDTFIHNGRGVFGSDFGSCSFVIRNVGIPAYRGTFRRLFDKQGSVAGNEELQQRFCTAKNNTPRNADFAKIPGSPVAYWATKVAFDSFALFPPMSEMATPRAGMITSNNAVFVRFWHEISRTLLGLGLVSREDARASGKKWFPYQKGGQFRKWYGNAEHVVNWQNDGYDIRTRTDDSGKVPAHAFNEEFIFKPNVNWSAVTISYFSVRITDNGSLFDAGGSAAFPNPAEVHYLAGFLNSPVSQSLIGVLNPTVNFQAWDIAKLPVKHDDAKFCKSVHDLVEDMQQIAKDDWNSIETSWDFQILPVLRHNSVTVQHSQDAADADYLARFRQMKELEEQNNRLFIDAYGFHGELSPEVSDSQLTLYRPNRGEDIKRLLSYSLGCAMGRYSLDKPGLIYANGGNDGFNPSQYKTFPADKDGIVPVTEIDWFPDSAACRFEEFVGVAWPKDYLEENLKFVAESLGPKDDEQPRDTIRRYFANEFYKHHLGTYKRRPIYWLFTSGKLGAFECLVYLHRYNEGTLARMRTEYVIPLQGKINARIDQLDGDKAEAASAAHRRRLEKEQELLKKQQIELQKFDEKLRHYADKRIKLDLDDGVKVNYAKFGDLLACVTQVCGKGEDDE